MTIFWNSPNAAYTTLRRIRKMGYLHDFYEREGVPAHFGNEMLLYVTPQGAALLRNKLGLADADINRPPFQTLRNWNSRQTLLSVNNIRAIVLRAHRDSPDFQVLDWINEHRFRAQPDYVLVGKKQQPVYPDGLMILETPDFYSYCYIEVDSGTEERVVVKRQLAIYHAYIRTDLHQHRFQSAGFRVLLITTSNTRMKNLIRDAHEVGLSGHFWFTTRDAVTPATVFTGKIWRRYVDGVEKLLSLAELG